MELDVQGMLQETPQTLFLTITRRNSALLNDLAVRVLRARGLRKQRGQLRQLRPARGLSAASASCLCGHARDPYPERAEGAKLRQRHAGCRACSTALFGFGPDVLWRRDFRFFPTRTTRSLSQGSGDASLTCRSGSGTRRPCKRSRGRPSTTLRYGWTSPTWRPQRMSRCRGSSTTKYWRFLGHVTRHHFTPASGV